MTEDRRKELAEHRDQVAMKDEQLESVGRLVDGVKEIQMAWARPDARQAIPEMVMAGKGVKGKAPLRKKIGVRR